MPETLAIEDSSIVNIPFLLGHSSIRTISGLTAFIT